MSELQTLRPGGFWAGIKSLRPPVRSRERWGGRLDDSKILRRWTRPTPNKHSDPNGGFSQFASTGNESPSRQPSHCRAQLG